MFVACLGWGQWDYLAPGDKWGDGTHCHLHAGHAGHQEDHGEAGWCFFKLFILLVEVPLFQSCIIRLTKCKSNYINGLPKKNGISMHLAEKGY